MTKLAAALTLSLPLPLFAQQGTLPGDAALQLLNHPPNAQAQFLNTNAGWQSGSVQQNAIFFKGPNGASQAAVIGNVTHQDPTSGSWVLNDASLSSTTNGWRLDGAAYAVFIRQSGAAQHVVSQTYTDYATQHASTLNLTLPTLTYVKGFTFGFNQDGLAWNLIFTSQGFFQIRTTVSKRIGKATHSFPVTSSEPLSVNSLGQLVGDTHAGLTQAVMIPSYGHPIPCSPWTYANGAASFSCDDTSLKDNQLPYIIDPQSQVTLTDGGTYNIDSWCDSSGNCGQDNATVNFNTSASVSGASTILWTSCGFDVAASDFQGYGPGGDQVQCSVTQPYTAGGTAQVVVSISSNDYTWDDTATVDDVTFSVGFNPPPAAATPVIQTNGCAGPISLSTSTSGASINYTLDGSTPTSVSGTLYTGPFNLTSAAYINAVAYGAQWSTSPVASVTFGPCPPPPTFSPHGGLYYSAQSVQIQPATNYANVYYTTDGTTPSATHGTEFSPGNPPTITVPLDSTLVVQAVSVATGPPPYSGSSTVAAATYTVTGSVSNPAISLASGVYITPQSVTLNTSTAGASIRYTTDGSTPTETHGTLYTGPISVASSLTLNAIAYETNWLDSGISQATYTITGTIATPTITFSGGNCTPGLGGEVCTGSPTISIATTSSGASIRYTTNGTTPADTVGTIYQSPFALSSTSDAQSTAYTVQAIGYESEWADSSIASLQFTITGTVGAPVFAPVGGIYNLTQAVTLSSVTSGAVIRYTTDGSTPTETHGLIYSSPISVTAPVTISAMAYETNWLDSAVTAESYYFDNPGGGGTGGGGSGGPGSGTPPSDSGNGLDPRRVGVRALGSYWGDAGENIDTISGNLSFANPLIKPYGRGSWSLPFMLSYNSQIWRHDSAGDWLLGADVGYGMGWKLQVGSLVPVWNSSAQIDHYIFTDASGAEYNLTVNTNGVWTSLEGTFISYDSNANKLYNTDGSYWIMGCTSSATEQDAGTMYPTQAEDSNGNYLS